MATNDDEPGGSGTIGGLAPTDGGAAVGGGLPPTLTDPQGRVFHLQQNPTTGGPQYRHASEQADAAGNKLSVEILIDIAADGSFTRRTSQDLRLANGDAQREVVVDRRAADGTQVGEEVDSFEKQGTATTSEHTVGSFAAGKLVRRETDIEQRDAATDPKTREQVTVTAKIHGTWFEQGEPITATTVPHVDRTDTQHIVSPGQGINKDTDRALTFTTHAKGPVNALDWDDAGTLVVRFDGHKGQYIEREMRVPLDQKTGAPNMAAAETVRTDDKQNLLNKGLMQARIWGGLASNLAWIIGVNFARSNVKGFVAFSAAASGAQLVGEAHAVATKRNDGSVTRLVVSAYDAVLTGMLAAYVGGQSRRGLSLTSGQRAGFTALGGVGVAAHGAQLSGVGDPIGLKALDRSLADVKLGADLQQPSSTSPRAPGLRMEPRFDAAAALLG